MSTYQVSAFTFLKIKISFQTFKPSSLQLYLEPNEEQLFTCHPEGLKPEKGAVRMAQYMDMRCPAAVGYSHPQSGAKTLVYGFPLEAVTEFSKIYRYSIKWLLEK